jgi:hypothetical protein
MLAIATGLLAASGCASSPAATEAPALQQALIEPEHVEQAANYECHLAERYEKFPAQGVSWFEVLEGPAPIIVTAPHATKSVRNGKLRSFADTGTGSLAFVLHQLTGATVIMNTHASPSDPNYYDDNDFKKKLQGLVETEHPLMVLDLHVSDFRRPYDIDLGTMGGASLLGREDLLANLVGHLNAEGLGNVSLNRFAASDHQTITKFVSGLGKPAIQLEINSTWTAPNGNMINAHRYAQLLQALTRFLREVAPISDESLKAAAAPAPPPCNPRNPDSSP